MDEISNHDIADKEFYITANTVLNIDQRAREIFESSEVPKKNQLLNFLLQNLELKDKNLLYKLKARFDTVLKANKCSSLLRATEEVRNYFLSTNERVFIPQLAVVS